MNGLQRVASLAALAALCLLIGAAPQTNAQAAAAPAAGQDAAGASKQPYTMAEYNAYQAAAADKTPASQVKELDDFVAKYPNSALLNFVYPLYYQAYSQLKNYPKVIEYADKALALGDKIDAGGKYQALYARAFAYNALNSTDPAQAKAAHDAALAGLKALEDLKKPDAMTDDAFATQKKQIQLYFNGTAAQTSMVQKDYAGAISAYKAVLVLNPDDAISSYRLGQAYLATAPPQTMDAFWAIARAVTSKGATQQQSTQVKTYLRKLLANYQGNTVCDTLTDGELNELLQLSSTTVDRPDSYKLTSAADIAAAQKDMTIASVIADLKAGGDKGKITWLAACGLEFPGVPGKLIESVAGEPLDLKIAFVTSEAEFDAATTANMEVKVAGQPEAGRVEKDNPIHFTGTLVSFDPDPAFMLHWEKAKVSDEDIPKEKTAPKKPAVRRPAAKKPA